MLRIRQTYSSSLGLGQTLVDPRDKCLADCVTQFPAAVADEQNRNVCQAGCIQKFPVGSKPILTAPSASAPPSSWSYVQQPDGSYAVVAPGAASTPASAIPASTAATPTPTESSGVAAVVASTLKSAVAKPWSASVSPIPSSDTINIGGTQVSTTALAVAAAAIGAFFLLGKSKS